MRFHFSLSPNLEPVNFNDQHFLAECLLRWLGANDWHDRLSLYSVGSLQDGGTRDGALWFPRGATWRMANAKR